MFHLRTMNKKAFLTIVIISLLVLGLTAPASGATLTDVSGEPVEIGSKITATSNNLVSTFGSGVSSSCENTAVEAEVAENGPEQVTLDQLSATATGCKIKPSGVPVVVKALTFGMIVLAEGEGSSPFKSSEELGGLITCNYGGTAGFTYEAETDVLSIPGSLMGLESGPGCPATKNLHGDFALANESGPVTID